MSAKPVLIVGAGLAGLCCARQLLQQGIDFLLLESQDDVGGRVRTDIVDGFRLDRGFQVLQTAYPEARRQLDYNALRLHPFDPGALIRTHGHMVTMSDPWRRPGQMFSTAFNGIGNLADRWKLAKLRWNVTHASLQEIWSEPDSTTDEYLRKSCGFSSDIVDRFFRPWFSGVFLEKELGTSSRFFKFIFRMFALGDASLPEGGMGAISKHLSDRLPQERIRLSTRVERVGDKHVRLDTQEVIEGIAIVLAVEGPVATQLTNGKVSSPAFQSTSCFYFSAPHPPIPDLYLVLDGDRSGPVNNFCVPSNVCPSYAPKGQALVSASVISESPDSTDQLQSKVCQQLRGWFGPQVDTWKHLKTYTIHNALPSQPPAFDENRSQRASRTEGLYQCGDCCETGSIHGAMLSGRKTADAVVAHLSGRRSPNVSLAGTD